jgi:hypothetical protein
MSPIVKTSSQALLADIKAVIKQYPGFKMTVRQVYYRLVAAQKIPNSQKSYRQVKELLGKARMEGLISFDDIEDRTRTITRVTDSEAVVGHSVYLVRRTDEELSVEEFQNGFLNKFQNLDRYYDLPRWFNQPNMVVVFVEKQALQGLFMDVCEEKQVDLVVCKGYPSHSVLNDLAKRLRNYDDRNIKLIYCGDYDPSGLDIDRDVQDKLYNTFGIDFDFERNAITLDQIDEYDIPPAPAKDTDSRTAGMEARLGEAMQVELDAIDPPDLKRIVSEAIDKHFDQDIYVEREKELLERKLQINDWVPTVLQGDEQ